MTKRMMNDDIKPNYRNGWWFFFELNGQQITHHSSALSGRERIWVNDDLVINRIGWGMFNTHEFDVGGTTVKLKSGFTRPFHIFTSRLDAELWQNDELISRQSSQFVSTAKLFWQFVWGCSAGASIAFFIRSVIGG